MKKSLMKVISAGLILTMGLAFASCSKKEDDAKFTIQEGKLIMATNAYFPPYEFYEGSEIVGIDAEIAKAVADKLGLELEIQDVEFESIITGIQSGKYDIGLAGMTVTEDRKAAVNFSSTYATGIQVVIVKSGSEITDADKLIDGDYKIGVQTGILSLICFLVFYFWYFAVSIKLYRKANKSEYLVKIGIGILCGTFGYMVVGLINDSMVVTAPLFWTLLGVGLACNSMIKKSLVSTDGIDNAIKNIEEANKTESEESGKANLEKANA